MKRKRKADFEFFMDLCMDASINDIIKKIIIL